MKTLDKQKPYGTVHGDTEGRVYEQDGVTFDAQGNEWQPPTPPDASPESDKKKK